VENAMKEFSVVIPVYNGELHILNTLEKLTEVLKNLNQSFEVILVNDGSSDGSWPVIDRFCKENENIVGVDLMKNFGQDNAILTGLKFSNAKYIVIMDDDLQHDPSDIPRLINEIEKGFDVVYAKFEKKQQSLVKNFGSWFNGKVANIVIRKPENVYLSPFKVLTSQVRDEIVNYEGPYPYVDGLIFRTTNKISQIPAVHYKREIGYGNYTIWKSFKVWLNLATSFSVIPLRISVLLGFSASLLAFLMAILFVAQYFLDHRGPSGWSSLIVTILFFSGVQLISIGIMGEYIGRTYIHLNRSPQSVLRKVINFKKQS
jgi:undecaprenyl-phosphate 4-deoxy-4-formamido-L-arabinose transferase